MIADNDAYIEQRELQFEPTVLVVGDGEVCWGGTDEESDALLVATQLHAECGVDCGEDHIDGTENPDCAVHQMLYDQRVLDGLLTVRRARQWWIDSENMVGGREWPR